MVVIAHVSDLHLDGGPRALRRARAVLDRIDDLPYDLDAVLVSGDVADHGRPEEYRSARELLAGCRHPVIACPGNHDDRSAFREHLLGRSAPAGPVNQALVTDRFVLAAADSTVPGRDDGRLDDETLDWLDDLLTRTTQDVPVLVAFHHPPVVLHCPYVDDLRQFGTDRLADLAGRHPHLRAFLCGHAHTPAAAEFAGRPVRVAPGVASTVRLPWEPRAHPGDHLDLDQPPGLAFHVLDQGRLVTHARSVSEPPSLA